MVAKAVVMICASSAIMKDASALTPSTQFFSALVAGSCIAPLRSVPAASCDASGERRTGEGGGYGRKIFLRGRILSHPSNVQGVERRSIHVAKPVESKMKRTLIRYKT